MSPPTLLIGERDPFMRRALEQTLQDQFELRFAEGGDDLVELARQQPPDLVITEAILPRRDGLQACRDLKSDPATRHIPILCFTFLLIEERARLAGADAFLLKPLREEVLVKTIHQLLETARPHPGPLPKGEGDSHPDNSLPPSGEGQGMRAKKE